MRIIGSMLALIISVAVGAAIAVAAQRINRDPQSGWVVAVGGESFVVLDKEGSPSEVCTLDVDETYCHGVRHKSDLSRQPVQRWRTAPRDAPSLAADALSV